MNVTVILLAWMMAQPADPLTDHMKYEIAAAQRDYLLAQQQMERTTAQLRSKIEAAQKACAGIEKAFDVNAFACTEKEKESTSGKK